MTEAKEGLMKRGSMCGAAVVCVTGLMAPVGHAAESSTVTKFIAVQVREKHPSDTSFIVENNDLVGARRIGTSTLTCRVVSDAKAACTITFRRTEGTITARLTLEFSESHGTGKITGGTKKYAGASGTLAFRNVNDEGTRTSVVLTLA
jgi:hypothetical protein